MPMQDTSNLTYALRTAYAARYLEAAEMERVYDRLAQPVGKLGVERAARLDSTVRVNFLGDMVPGSSAIPESYDVTPTKLRDAYTEITPTSRYGALEWTELIDLEAYTNYGEQRFKALGKNQMETVDLLAQAAALQGGNLYRGVAARSSLDAGTSGHRLTDTVFAQVDVRLQSLKTPAYVDGNKKSWFALMHPYAYHDVRLGGNVISVAQYQQASIILNQEVGSIGSFRLIATPWAKVFWSAGSNNASAIGTTVSTAFNELTKTFTVASATNIDVGDYMMVGTIETANTFYPTNERVLVTGVSGSDITIAGEGANGGFRFAHAAGETVSNADSVFPVVFGGPSSLVKLYDSEIGEFGSVVGPKKYGTLEQFAGVSWKWYGNYGRIVESWLLRGEFASVLEA